MARKPSSGSTSSADSKILEKEVDVMSSAAYNRASTKVITEALKKGFDILQLENGDIVTTGTKVIVTHYAWDTKKGDLRKLTEAERKKRKSEIEASRASKKPKR